ncbi:MAG: hypothetical protein K5853_09410 [Lachnospiraceae bacterium]|nr:hypothetical protein [Lachnospiraceae bacterium]
MWDIRSVFKQQRDKTQKKNAADIGNKISFQMNAIREFAKRGGEKYLDENGDILYKSALLDYLEEKSIKSDRLPEVNEAYLLSDEGVKSIPYDPKTNLGGTDLADLEKHLVEFKRSESYQDLFPRDKKEFDARYALYLEDRRGLDKKQLQVAIYRDMKQWENKEYVIITSKTDQREVMIKRPSLYTKSQRQNISSLGLLLDSVTEDEIYIGGSDEGLTPDMILKYNAFHFEQWCLKRGLHFTQNVPE